MSTNDNLRRLIPAVIAMSGLICAGAVAHAGTIVNVTFPGQTHHAASTSSLGVGLDEGLNSPAMPHARGTPTAPAVTNVGFYGGSAFDFRVDNPSSTQFLSRGGGTSSTSVLSFCIEVTESIQNGPTNLPMILLANSPAQTSGQNVDGRSAASVPLNENPWDKYINSVVNSPAGLTTSQAAAAFQLTVRKVEYDGNDPSGSPGSVNFGNGFFEATAANAGDPIVLGAAGNWTNRQSLNPSPGELANLVASSRANSHDPVSHVNQNAAPEPSSNLIWLLVAAIGVYPIMRRRSSAA